MNSISATSARDTHRPVASSKTASVYSIGVQASSPIVAIAVLTLESSRTVTEAVAPALSAALTGPRPVERGVGATSDLSGDDPCWRLLTFFSASATRCLAPRGEPHDPFHSRCATTTGAESFVVTVASRAFRPRTPEYPYPEPCFV